MDELYHTRRAAGWADPTKRESKVMVGYPPPFQTFSWQFQVQLAKTLE
jgi:predicted nicotinamide N-methyase